MECPDTSTVTSLRIRSIRKVCDFAPSRPCADTIYGPALFLDPSPADPARRELLLTQGGHLDFPQDFALSSPGRFADKLYESVRVGDGWSSPREIVGKSLFPWMADDILLGVFSGWCVGGCASPNIIPKIGSTYHLIFTASVNDPNCCVGEHQPEPNPYGSCRQPWSYFAVFWATSPDGIAWTLRDMGRPHSNTALRHAALYCEPSPADVAAGLFKGIAAVHAIEHEGYIYLFLEFWNAVGERNVLVRTAVVDDLSNFEIWHGGLAWEPLIDGRLPKWANASIYEGNPYAHIINQVSPASLVPGYRFILTSQGAGMSYGGRGMNNCIELAGSNDLTNWASLGMVPCDFRVADGTGADNLIINPIYFEDANGQHFLFCTNDYDLDGVPDCAGAYPGLAVFQGDVTVPMASVERRRAVRHA
jgi:hypothetical protein